MASSVLLTSGHEWHRISIYKAIKDGDGSRQEGPPEAVCITVNLKKPLPEEPLFFYDGLMSRMLRVLHNFLHFM